MAEYSFVLPNPILETKREMKCAKGENRAQWPTGSAFGKNCFVLDVGVPCPLVCTTHMHARTLIFLYCSVSTLKPIVGMVCTASSLSFCSLYRIVVLPALSNPKIKIRTSLDPNRVSKRRLIMIPMVDEYNFFPKHYRKGYRPKHLKS